MSICTFWKLWVVSMNFWSSSLSALIRQDIFKDNFEVVGLNETISIGHYKKYSTAECAAYCVKTKCVGFALAITDYKQYYCHLGTDPNQLSSSLYWTIHLRNDPCSQKILNDGRPVVVRRDGSENFTRTWADYKAGFGDPDTNYWIGLDTLHTLHTLTSSGNYRLRVDMMDWEGNSYWAEYNSFSVGPESDNYQLSVSGYNASSTASPALTCNCKQGRDGMMFSTIDRDNDGSTGHCASLYQGGWWHNHCHRALPTGTYLYGGVADWSWINWRPGPLGSHESYSFQFMSLSLLLH